MRRSRRESYPAGAMPIRVGRRGGDGYGLRFVAINGRIDDLAAELVAWLVLPRSNQPINIDRITRRRVLLVRREGGL